MDADFQRQLRAILTPIAMVAFFVAAIYCFYRQAEFYFNSITVLGAITGRNVTYDRHSHPTYTVTFEFKTERGDKMASSDTVNWDQYDDFKVGHNIKVDYLESDPTANEISGQHYDLKFGSCFLLFSFICAIFFGFDLYIMYKSPNRTSTQDTEQLY